MGVGRSLRLTKSGNNWGQEQETGVAGVQELQNFRPPLGDFEPLDRVFVYVGRLVLVVVLRPRLSMEEG